MSPGQGITGKGEINAQQLEPTAEEVRLLAFMREHAPPNWPQTILSKFQGLVSGTGASRACYELNTEGKIVVAQNVEAGSTRSAYT